MSPATKVPKNQVIPESKVGQTSTVNLNLNHRRLKRHERQQQINSTISETLNLFQALEVRSEPVSDPEDFSGFKGMVLREMIELGTIRQSLERDRLAPQIRLLVNHIFVLPYFDSKVGCYLCPSESFSQEIRENETTRTLLLQTHDIRK